MNKKNQGITLIALVITIIVLLILAGVAISMLSGENGILNKAKEAKEKTEEGQKQEETTLTDYEIDMHFIANNSKYKCKYGMITGFEVGIDTVGKLKDALPQNEGYEVYSEDDEKDPLSNTEKITTGMLIKRGDTKVARTVIFGDINGSDDIGTADVNLLINYLNDEVNTLKEYNIAAADVNHDNSVDNIDKKSIEEYMADKYYIDQQVYVSNPKTLKLATKSKIIEEYINNIPKKFSDKGYSLEKGKKLYVIKGITRGVTTVEELKDVLPPNTVIKCGDQELTEGQIGSDETGAVYKVYIRDQRYEEDISVCKFE